MSISPHNDILFYGDPHGSWEGLYKALDKRTVADVIVMGDMDLTEPLTVVRDRIADFGAKLWWIPGNHDADRQDWFSNSFDSYDEGNLSRRAQSLSSGHVVAGLGGIFRGSVWWPKEDAGVEPKFKTRQELSASLPVQKRWRSLVPMKHHATIFPEDVEALAGMRADILVTHEAPLPHQHGFQALNSLAANLGVKLVVHGHHHKFYVQQADGFTVVGTRKASACWLSDIQDSLSA